MYVQHSAKKKARSLNLDSRRISLKFFLSFLRHNVSSMTEIGSEKLILDRMIVECAPRSPTRLSLFDSLNFHSLPFVQKMPYMDRYYYDSNGIIEGA